MSFRGSSVTLVQNMNESKRRSSSVTPDSRTQRINGTKTVYAIDDMGTKQARLLFDYEAQTPQELSATKNEIVIVYRLPGMDPDFVMAEKGGKRGRIPFSYLEII
uniref:SH3 domain-containing protein n=1 Tax=Ascaris lumbricoides TaxID=6252 RepID=A0A0M3IND7_ASCLU